jgi:hypothetical protein
MDKPAPANVFAEFVVNIPHGNTTTKPGENGDALEFEELPPPLDTPMS